MICVDSRQYLNVPYAHQNLVSGAMLPYFKSYDKLPIEKQLSMLKGLLNFYCLEEIQKNKISDHIYKQKIISQGLTLFDKYKIYADIPVNNDDLATNTVSYIKIVNQSEHDEIITLSDQPYWTELFSGDKYDSISNFECKSQGFSLMYHTEICLKEDT